MLVLFIDVLSWLASFVSGNRFGIVHRQQGAEDRQITHAYCDATKETQLETVNWKVQLPDEREVPMVSARYCILGNDVRTAALSYYAGPRARSGKRKSSGNASQHLLNDGPNQPRLLRMQNALRGMHIQSAELWRCCRLMRHTWRLCVSHSPQMEACCDCLVLAHASTPSIWWQQWQTYDIYTQTSAISSS